MRYLLIPLILVGVGCGCQSTPKQESGLDILLDLRERHRASGVECESEDIPRLVQRAMDYHNMAVRNGDAYMPIAVNAAKEVVTQYEKDCG